VAHRKIAGVSLGQEQEGTSLGGERGREAARICAASWRGLRTAAHNVDPIILAISDRVIARKKRKPAAGARRPNQGKWFALLVKTCGKWSVDTASTCSAGFGIRPKTTLRHRSRRNAWIP